jgi:hypothetical protein
MRVIKLDATNWRTLSDLSCALKAALGSVEGHGNSINAWVDSIIYGGMNAIEPPFVIRITGVANCSVFLKEDILALSRAIDKARTWKLEHYGVDVDASFEFADGPGNSN